MEPSQILSGGLVVAEMEPQLLMNLVVVAVEVMPVVVVATACRMVLVVVVEVLTTQDPTLKI
jgi:hypothetical protein